MIKILILSAILSVITFTSINSQGQTPEKVSLSMVIGDFAYLRSEFDEIEIKATEVDALIGIQKSMDNVMRSPVIMEKEPYEVVTIDIIKTMANNMLVFMDRMIIKGKDAVRFQRFRNNLQQAISGS
jgi:hypothetical protein